MIRDGYVLLASIGFSSDFILRRISDIRASNNPSFVIVVGLDAGDGLWDRVEKTFLIVKHYLSSIGIKSELKKIKLSSNIIKDSRDIIYEAIGKSSNGVVELFLSGGPRLLVVSLLSAAYIVERDYADRIIVVSYGEGFPGSISYRLSTLKAISRLDPDEINILRSINRGLDRVSVLKEALNMPRSTLYLKINKLIKMNLIRRERGRLVVQEDLDLFL